jgi:tetratricopeptide (TPR) repeat protein/tRNA A-37 threonylcarbamoyl transferase component Bud32
MSEEDVLAPTDMASTVAADTQDRDFPLDTLFNAVPERNEVATGTIIGRYVVLSKLGAGAMGVVLAAYDPALDRKVALKLLKARSGPHDAARARLQREAQALARLDHHNVVTVYDVGVDAGQLFVGMEFVEGQTLGEWMGSTDEPRPWPEVVRVFMEAGRGLAAAHQAGLVHRDFKPDNVMLGKDGRVRVMDFGLVRSNDVDGDSEVSVEPTLEQVKRNTGKHQQLDALTQTGTMLGTPAYMATEQFEGREADARSDQFSFCVALYQALYGERPFAGSTLAQLIRSVADEQIREPAQHTRVPAWLRKVVVRGLAVDRDARWPSMVALLAALADDPAVRRRKWWAATLAAGVLGGTVWGTWYAMRVDAQTCAGFEERLAGVWDDARRAEVEAAIEATKLSYAPTTWMRVEERLDEYTRAWVAARAQACEATQEGEQSGELLDLRMACLDERLQHVRATVNVLAVADETVVNKAVQAVAGLPSLERCADVDALRAELPPPEDPAVAARVVELDERLIDAQTLEKAGKYAEGLTIADAVVRDAAALGYEPLQVRAWLQQGVLQYGANDYATAQATLEQSYEAAVALQMAAEAATASSLLVAVVGVGLAQHDEGRRLAKDAKAWMRAVGTDEAHARYYTDLGILAGDEGKYDEASDYYERALAIREKALGPDHPLVAGIVNNLGIVAGNEGKYDEERVYHERALAIMEKVLGPDHPDLAAVLNNLGTVARNEGANDEARGYYERALAIWEKALGRDHPDVASVLINLGVVAHDEGTSDKARGYYERALAIWEKALGPDHPDVAYAISNLGFIAHHEGKYDEARGYFQRALAIREKALGPAHPEVASDLNKLGVVAEHEGKYDEARGYFERALAIMEKAVGPDHPEVAGTLHNLGSVAEHEGKYDEARGHNERALDIMEKAVGPDHPYVAFPLIGLGEAMLGQGHPSEALPHLERALTLRSANNGNPRDLADIHFVLARALWDAAPEVGQNRDRAKILAGLAHTAYVEAGEAKAKQLEEVQAWEREHTD